MRDRGTIGARIRLVRKRAGLTQVQMGQALGVTRRLLGDWERGTSWPSVLDIANIAERYGVRCDWLVLGEGEMDVDRP